MGFDNTLGFLKGGFESWVKAGKEVDFIDSRTVSSLEDTLEKPETPVFDVRKQSEYDAEHLANAQNTPLDFINDHITNLPGQEIFYIHCASGFRSVITASILKSRGIHNFVEIDGGFEALKESDLEISEYVCPKSG